MKRMLTRRLIAFLLLLSLLLPSYTGIETPAAGSATATGDQPADTARLLCPPSPTTNNPCVSWNS